MQLINNQLITKCFCDFCGHEIDEYPEELTFEINYNTEDPCYFCSPGPEERLYDKTSDLDCYDDIYESFSDSKVVMCKKCRTSSIVSTLLRHVRNTRATAIIDNLKFINAEVV